MSYRLVGLLGSLVSLVGTTPVTASDPPQIIRVGLIQMDGRILDKEYNLGQAELLIRQAAARGARIVCTPESAVQGYPRVSLPEGGSPDAPEIVEERNRILEAAEPLPGPSSERFAKLARELGIWIVYGIDERRGETLFNTAVLVNPAGEIVGTYSKVHLQNWMLASGVNRGDSFPVWEIEVDGIKLKVGIQICYDIQHPESSRELALGGAEIIFVPYCTRDFSRPLLVHLFQTRALENRAFVVRVNYGAPRNSGTSSILDFEGATQDELDRQPGVLVGDLNLTALREVRNTWNKVYGPANRYPAAYKRMGAQ